MLGAGTPRSSAERVGLSVTVISNGEAYLFGVGQVWYNALSSAGKTMNAPELDFVR